MYFENQHDYLTSLNQRIGINILALLFYVGKLSNECIKMNDKKKNAYFVPVCSGWLECWGEIFGHFMSSDVWWCSDGNPLPPLGWDEIILSGNLLRTFPELVFSSIIHLKGLSIDKAWEGIVVCRSM